MGVETSVQCVYGLLGGVAHMGRGSDSIEVYECSVTGRSSGFRKQGIGVPDL